MSDIGDWFKSIPFITRYWFAGSIAVPLIGKLGLINPMYLVLWPENFFHKFQLLPWHPSHTSYCPGGTGFLYLVNLYFLYQYSTRLETGAFDGRPADFVFMLLFNWLCIVLLMIPLIMSVLYVWAQLNRETIVSFWFGTRFKACYLPWVILGFNYIIGGSVVNELIGNLVGHLYFFLMFKYPMDLGGRSFLSTPDFLYRFLPNRRGGVSGFGAPPSRRPAAPEAGGGGGGMGGRHAWGAGFRLGDD
uniref:Derlin n=1 Tax=Hucho hucho TaxID=62062 RepID=A0A4W5KAF8_9TELE